MQNVSEKWKENQKNIIASEAFLEITYDVTDPDALSDATATDNDTAHPDANTPSIINGLPKNPQPFTTFEMNRWVLDGNNVHIPARGGYGDTCFVTEELCDANGHFTKNPIIDITFTQAHRAAIPGITIAWDYMDYATKLKVTVYNNGNMVNEFNIVGTSPTTVVQADIENYDRISVEIQEWCLPYRRARIREIFIGLYKIYDKSILMSYSQKSSVDPLSAELPDMSINYSIDNTSGEYNPEAPNSWAKYMMERQEVSVRYGFDIEGQQEWIDGGTYYLTSWEAPQNGLTASFEARSIFEFLTDTWLKGMFDPLGKDLYSLAEEVLLGSKLPLANDGTRRWVIDSSLKNIKTTAPLPVVSIAECLEMIANMGRCILYSDRQGILHIERATYQPNDYVINDFNSYQRTEVSLSKPLSQVDVRCYSYFASGEQQEVYSGVVEIHGIETYSFIYSGAAVNCSVEVTGGTLVESTLYTNACFLTIEADGDVTVIVRGRSLDKSESVVTVMGDEPAGEPQSVENVIVTSPSVAKDIGQWVKEFYTNRKTLSSNFRIDPRLDVMDVIKVENQYNTNNVRITDIDIEYTGAFKGNTEGRAI